jgi:hypothetical protein
VPGLLQCVQEVTWAGARGSGDVHVARILLHFLPTWLPWAAFTPLVLALAKRFPLTSGSIARSLPIHVFACMGFGAAHILMLGIVRVQFPPAPWLEPKLGPWIVGTLWSLQSHAEVLVYVGLVLTGHTLEALRTARERQLGALKLEAQLSEARLVALRGQLQPHFLFNTLNAIDVLMTDDTQAARRMLLRLSELLRRTLEGGAQEHSLRVELEHLRCYLDIEHVRFSDRLHVSYDIEPAVLDLDVPALLLQPLVENAVRHGIAPRANGGSVTVRGRMDGDALELIVEDDGVGLSGRIHDGVGLGNTRARLAERYGAGHEFSVKGQAAGGVRVRVRIPAGVPSTVRPQVPVQATGDGA